VSNVFLAKAAMQTDGYNRERCNRDGARYEGAELPCCHGGDLGSEGGSKHTEFRLWRLVPARLGSIGLMTNSNFKSICRLL
jgi:hypothetical protein